MKAKDIKTFLEAFFIRFSDCRTPTWAASVAFYTALSLAPVLVIFLALSPLIDESLKITFVEELEKVVGPVGANAVGMILANAENRIELASISGIIGTVTLMLSASLVFGELRAAFSQILESYPTPPTNPSYFHYVFTFVKGRVFQLGLAVGFVFILIASLIVTTGIAALIKIGAPALGDLAVFVNFAGSFLLYIAVFLLIFRFLPQSHLPWRESIESATLTSALFVIGKELVGAYLGHSVLNSSYGAAGSVIVLLAWVYYSSLIIFVGAHVSYVLQRMRHAEKSLSKPSPAPPLDFTDVPGPSTTSAQSDAAKGQDLH